MAADNRGIFERVNPFTILVGMGVLGLFRWAIYGNAKGTPRQITTLPEYDLGERLNGYMITGMRSTWEYQVDDDELGLPEETL